MDNIYVNRINNHNQLEIMRNKIYKISMTVYGRAPWTLTKAEKRNVLNIYYDNY